MCIFFPLMFITTKYLLVSNARFVLGYVSSMLYFSIIYLVVTSTPYRQRWWCGYKMGNWITFQLHHIHWFCSLLLVCWHSSRVSVNILVLLYLHCFLLFRVDNHIDFFIVFSPLAWSADFSWSSEGLEILIVLQLSDDAACELRNANDHCLWVL